MYQDLPRLALQLTDRAAANFGEVTRYYVRWVVHCPKPNLEEPHQKHWDMQGRSYALPNGAFMQVPNLMHLRSSYYIRTKQYAVTILT